MLFRVDGCSIGRNSFAVTGESVEGVMMDVYNYVCSIVENLFMLDLLTTKYFTLARHPHQVRRKPHRG